MPKHTRPTSHYSPYNPMPVTMAPASTSMAYYGQRQTQAMYYPTDGLPTSAPQQSMAVGSYHDAYAVAPLTIPTAADAGAIGSTSVVPPQHRASSGAWSFQDDQTLLAARAKGDNWAKIQSDWFPNKTPNACRKRHERLMERRGHDDWDNRKMERLAKEYMNLRKEIWTPLAQATGEKWSVVEQKCMSNGLKNLQGASRAYSRRERHEAGQPPLPYDDLDGDSGISGVGGLTPVDEIEHYSSPEDSTTASGGHSSAASTSSAPGGYSAPTVTYSQYHQPTTHHQQYYGGQHQAHHAYTSSVSTAQIPSQGGSPYMGHHTRLPSVDMGIDSIINRPGHHAQ